MCGLFGYITCKPALLQASNWIRLIRDLAFVSESRGKDATGLMALTNDSLVVLKRPGPAKQLFSDSSFDTFSSTVEKNLSVGLPCVVMGHTRMATNGNEMSHENNQPVSIKALCCLHNGIIVNERILRGSVVRQGHHSELDSALIPDSVLDALKKGMGYTDAVESTLRQIQGANTVILGAADRDCLALYSANGSLYTTLSRDGSTLIFASEKHFIQKVTKKYRYATLSFEEEPGQIAACTGVWVFFHTDKLDCSPMFALAPEKDGAGKRTVKRVIMDIQDTTIPTASPAVITSEYASLEKLCAIPDENQQRIDGLRRCTRCILPETFPFIEFDEQGVCSYCRSYQPLTFLGKHALEKKIAPLRSVNGSTDCLLPLSGGRDSSYSLHYVVRELGLKPVAYTYDWGMVTDLARRNISRMCGELGVEHVLVAANIARKRANIRKNVTAWLHKPHLGAVTLFMAGDKQYFYYSWLLQKQMNLGLTFLGDNPFERTDFKVGFCGIDNKRSKDAYFTLSLRKKIRLLAFFSKQLGGNPLYWNDSLLDSLSAFASYYILPQNFLSFYKYIPWDENVINHTLQNKYGWETASDTKTTWRIGDGTAAFYNYIYYRTSGFSENDTFRSNQIRNGVMNREQALTTVREDNTPRAASLQWYCDTIGIDPVATILRINKMQTYY